MKGFTLVSPCCHLVDVFCTLWLNAPFQTLRSVTGVKNIRLYFQWEWYLQVKGENLFEGMMYKKKTHTHAHSHTHTGEES